MEFRKQKDVDEILEFVSSKFTLTLDEESVLSSVLNLFLGQKTEAVKQVNDLIEGDYYEVLKTIPNSSIVRYYQNNFEDLANYETDELVDELYHRNFNWISEIDTHDAIDLVEESGYTVSYDDNELNSSYDLVDAGLFEEIRDKFDSLTIFDRPKLKEHVLNFK